MNTLYRLVCGLFLLSCSVYLPAQETINKVIMDNGNSILWTINQPNVTQAAEVFPQIVFLPNDEVFITAGGCVQTGGSGATWKSYVHPSGDNSDRLYSGLIMIPGVTLGPQRIAGYLGKTLLVPNNPSLANSFLTLGYQDDQYNDNGYYKHDDGTENQCRGVGDASITIKITHHASPAPEQPRNFLDFDIVATDWDDNGLPLNPKFGGQVNRGPNAFPSLKGETDHFFPNHTSFPVTWESNDICSDNFSTFVNVSTLYLASDEVGNRAGWPADHINLLPIAYRGVVTWDQHSGSDDDYNFDVTSKDNACYTDDSHQVQVEFDSDETVDHWDHTATWWVDFHHNGVDRSHEAAVAKVDGDSAFIIGLLGIDAQHQPHFELHPAFVFFIKETNGNLDVYHFFVRNWGDEGYCSEHMQYLDLNTIRITLPNALSMISNSVFSGSYNDNTDGMNWVPTTMSDGIMLTFNLKNPDQKSWFEGDLSFTRKMIEAESIQPLNHLVTLHGVSGKTGTDEMLDKKVMTLSPALRKKMMEEIKGRFIETKAFLTNPVIHTTMANGVRRHSDVPVVINRDFVRVFPSATLYKKSPAETVKILQKYFPVKKQPQKKGRATSIQ